MVRPRFVCLALALVTLLVFLPVRRHGFVLYDDPDYLTENRTVQAGLTAEGFEWAFTTWHASNWHPLTWLSHMLDCELFGLDAGAHHLVSVLFHTASAVAILLLLFRLTGALWPSALVAALFAMHPLHVESVAWAAERKDVLSGFFFMLTLWAYARYAHSPQSTVHSPQSTVHSPQSTVHSPQSDAPRSHALPAAALAKAGPRTYYVLSLLLFALGLMSKPMLVTVPFVLLLLDYWPLRRFELTSKKLTSETLVPLLREKLPFFILCAASCVITIFAQRAEAMISLEPYPFSLRLENAVLSYARYLLNTVWPAPLAIIYPLPRQLPAASVITAAAFLAGLTWFAWRNRQERPHLLVGWLWFLGMLLPVIGLVQVGGQAMADRYTYLPLIGIFFAVAFDAVFWVEKVRSDFRLRRPVFAAIIAGSALAACIAATEVQLRYWKDSEALFAHAVAVTKDNAIARVNLGVALEQQDRRKEALVQYEAAVRIDPNLAQAHNNLGNLLEQSGKPAEALAHYREALRLKPNAPLAHDNLATSLVKLGQYDEAMRHYALAAQLDPQDPRPHYLMAKALLRQGRSAAALPHFHDALKLDANDVKTLTYLARMLASEPDPSVRDGAEAVQLAERANLLSGGEQTFVLDTLAMAYAEAGRFADARQTLQQALDRAIRTNDKEACPALEERLRLYQSNHPFREPATNAPLKLQLQSLESPPR